MKKNGFTLIEILISLAIIAALASISIPAIYNNVMKIEQASTVESAMNGLRQFFVDARAKSVKNEEKFDFVYTRYDGSKIKSLMFTNGTDETIYYTPPQGIRTQLILEIPKPPQIGMNTSFHYILGLFTKFTDTGKPSDRAFEIEGDDEFEIYIKVNDELKGTLYIDKGLPKIEYEN